MSCCIAVCVRASSAASPRFGADGLSVAQLLGATPVLAPTRAVPLLFEEGYIYIYINIYIYIYLSIVVVKTENVKIIQRL